MILLSVVSSHHLANHSSLSTEGDHSMEEELREKVYKQYKHLQSRGNIHVLGGEYANDFYHQVTVDMGLAKSQKKNVFPIIRKILEEMGALKPKESADAMEEKDCGKARALLTLFGFRLLTHHLFLCFHART